MSEPIGIKHFDPKVVNHNGNQSLSDHPDQECIEFQARMSERIGAGEDLQSYSHMQTCQRCQDLVRDLEYIAEVAHQLIPVEEEPQSDLWAKIELAIERGEV
jgi:hypothetical protein